MAEKDRHDHVKRAQLVHIITLLELGGAQENTLINCSRADPELFDVSLISGEGGILDERGKSLTGVSFYGVPHLVRAINPVKDLRAFFTIFSILRKVKRRGEGRPVIVHTHSSKAGIIGRIAAALAGCDVIVHTVHGFGFTPLQGFFTRRFLIFLEKVVSHVTDRFVLVSRENGKEGMARGIFDGSRCTLIRSGFDTDRFMNASRERGRKLLGIEEEDFSAGMVACLKPQKAPLDFIHAAKIVKEKGEQCIFILVGDGELRPDVMEEIVESGLGPDFLMPGWIDDIWDVIAAFDVLVLTSIHEGLPKVIPQSLLAGVPVVATSVDGAVEVIEDGVNGFLVDVHDPKEVALRIEDVKKGVLTGGDAQSSREEMVVEFSSDSMVAKHKDLYLQLLQEKGWKD